MNPDHDPTRRPRVYYEEEPMTDDEVKNDEAHAVMATVVVICGVVITVIIGAVIGGILLFDKYKHYLGL